jgi:serine/threonine protein phosphatase PrpC
MGHIETERARRYAEQLSQIRDFEGLFNWLQFHPNGGIESSVGFMNSDYWVQTIEDVRSGREKISAVTSTNGLRDKVAELLQLEQSTQVETVAGTADILDGERAEDLYSSALVYETLSHDRLVAGTEKGVNYKATNEDRVVVDPVRNFVAVVDGVGGDRGGEVSAQILAEALKKNPTNIQRALENAYAQMVDEEIGEQGGAVFISAEIIEDPQKRKYLDINQVGDATLFVADKAGVVRFNSIAHGPVAEFVKDGTITADEALYHQRRNEVYDTVNGREAAQAIRYSSIILEKGDRVFIMTDGISDNLTSEEISHLTNQMSIEQAMQVISDVTGRRMKDYKKILESTKDRRKQGRYSDGYRSAPKPDNRSLVIVEIN